jgi:hypothetical protein
MDLEQLKTAIWEYMSGRYRTPIKALVDELHQPEQRIRKALELLIVEERVFEIFDEGEEILYRCLFQRPFWVDAVMEATVCEGWPGLTTHYIGEDHQLCIYPAPFIREGHESEGICWMGHWHVEVNELLDLFDDPQILFGETNEEGVQLSIEGKIDEEDVWVEFSHKPPKGSLPVLLMTADGEFQELTEEEIADYEERYGGDDDREEKPPPGSIAWWKPSEN